MDSWGGGSVGLTGRGGGRGLGGWRGWNDGKTSFEISPRRRWRRLVSRDVISLCNVVMGCTVVVILIQMWWQSL